MGGEHRTRDCETHLLNSDPLSPYPGPTYRLMAKVMHGVSKGEGRAHTQEGREKGQQRRTPAGERLSGPIYHVTRSFNFMVSFSIANHRLLVTGKGQVAKNRG